ncbi:MAG: PAS domain-containing protein [Bacteroidota bacterium]
MSPSLEYLEHFFHGTPAGTVLMTSRIISFANSRMEDITGYSKKDLMSKHAGILYPSERESKRMEKFFYPLLQNEGIATIETRWRCKSGEIRDMFLVGALLDSKSNLEKSDDNKESVLIVVFDISRRKNIGKALRRDELNPDEALEKMGEGFWDWDIESGNVRFNDSWIKMLGYKRKDIEFHIRTWQNLVHPDDWHYVRKTLNDHLWGDAESYAVECRLKSNSGEWVRVFDYGRVIDQDEHQYPLRFIGNTIDITYLEKSEQKNFTSERQMSEVTRSDSSFSPKVFRKKTIFAKGMEGFLQLLQNPFASHEQRTRYLELILSSGSRIHELANNLMNVSRLNSDQPGMKNIGQKDDQGLQYELTVLIVEDDRSNAFLLSEVLKSCEIRKVDINPQIATNGKDAVEFCKNNPVDLVLMDIKLPVMNGLTACRKIKLLKPEIPVVAQTACAYPSDMEEIFAAGFSDYLVKPIGIGLIRQKLKKYLVAGNSNRVFYEN